MVYFAPIARIQSILPLRFDVWVFTQLQGGAVVFSLSTGTSVAAHKTNHKVDRRFELIQPDSAATPVYACFVCSEVVHGRLGETVRCSKRHKAQLLLHFGGATRRYLFRFLVGSLLTSLTLSFLAWLMDWIPTPAAFRSLPYCAYYCFVIVGGFLTFSASLSPLLVLIMCIGKAHIARRMLLPTMMGRCIGGILAGIICAGLGMVAFYLSVPHVK